MGSLLLCAVFKASGSAVLRSNQRAALSREAAGFVSGVAKDAFGLWLNQETADAERLPNLH